MKHTFANALGCVLVFQSPAFAADRHLMNGAEILATFPGMTMTGNYADGVNFAETYHLGGKISYRDDKGVDTGNWFERDGMFCTFYLSADGACFKIIRTGVNCFEMYVAKGQNGKIEDPVAHWNSVGWDETRPSTCDLSDKTV